MRHVLTMMVVGLLALACNTDGDDTAPADEDVGQALDTTLDTTSDTSDTGELTGEEMLECQHTADDETDCRSAIDSEVFCCPIGPRNCGCTPTGGNSVDGCSSLCDATPIGTFEVDEFGCYTFNPAGSCLDVDPDVGRDTSSDSSRSR